MKTPYIERMRQRMEKQSDEAVKKTLNTGATSTVKTSKTTSNSGTKKTTTKNSRGSSAAYDRATTANKSTVKKPSAAENKAEISTTTATKKDILLDKAKYIHLERYLDGLGITDTAERAEAKEKIKNGIRVDIAEVVRYDQNLVEYRFKNTMTVKELEEYVREYEETSTTTATNASRPTLPDWTKVGAQKVPKTKQTKPVVEGEITEYFAPDKTDKKYEKKIKRADSQAGELTNIILGAGAHDRATTKKNTIESDKSKNTLLEDAKYIWIENNIEGYGYKTAAEKQKAREMIKQGQRLSPYAPLDLQVLADTYFERMSEEEIKEYVKKYGKKYNLNYTDEKLTAKEKNTKKTLQEINPQFKKMEEAYKKATPSEKRALAQQVYGQVLEQTTDSKTARYWQSHNDTPAEREFSELNLKQIMQQQKKDNTISQEEWASMQQRAKDAPIAGGLLNVVARNVAGIPAFVEGFITNPLRKLTTGEDVDFEDSPALITYNKVLTQQRIYSETMREENGDTAGFLYDTGMTVAEFVLWALLAAATSGVASGFGAAAKTAATAGTIAVNVTQAAQTGAMKAVDSTLQGNDTYKTMVLSALSFAQDYAVGEIPIRKITGGILGKNVSNMERSFLRGILKQEAETIASVAFMDQSQYWFNIVTDYTLNRENSELYFNMLQAQQEGLSESEAFNKALGQTASAGVQRLGQSMITGAMLGLTALPANIANRKSMRAVGEGIRTQGNEAALIEDALSMDKNTESYKLAERLQNLQGDGKRVRAEALGQLRDVLIKDLDGEITQQLKGEIQTRIESYAALTDSKTDAKRGAEAIVKRLNMDKNVAGDEAVFSDPNVQKVYNELISLGTDKPNGWAYDVYARAGELRERLQTVADMTERNVLEDNGRAPDEIDANFEKARRVSEQKERIREAMDREGVEVQENVSTTEYSIVNTQHMSWQDQIEGYYRKDGSIKRNDTLVLENGTPSYLIENGVENKPIVIPTSVISKAQNGKDVYHSISDDSIKQLQDGIENAIAIIDNPDRNAVVFITDIQENGMPILVAVEKNTEFDGDKVHKVTSIHLQQDTVPMISNLSEDATVWIQKNNEFDKLSRNADKTRPRTKANIKLIDNRVTQSAEKVKSDTENADDTTVHPDSIFEEADLTRPDETLMQTLMKRASGETETDAEAKIQTVAKKLGREVKYFRGNAKIEGFTKNGVIYVNRNAEVKRPMNYTFKHELLHTLQDSGYYKPFTRVLNDSDVFKNWLESKYGSDNLDVAVDDVMARYGNLLEADAKGDRFAAAQREVYAEFVGDKLLGGDFESTIKSLGRLADRSFIGTIKRIIHNIAVKFKGTAEEKALLKLEKEFDKLYEGRDVKYGDSAEGSTYFSIRKTTNGSPVLVVNDDITKFASNDKELISLVKKAIVKFKSIPINGQTIHFIRDTKNEFTNSRYTEFLRKNDHKKYSDKMRIANHPYDIVIATTDYVNEAPKHARKDGIVDFARGKILIDVNGTKYKADVDIGFTKRGICELHDIVNMEETSFEYKKETTPETMDSTSESDRSGVISNDSILRGEAKSQDVFSQNSGNNESGYTYSLSPEEQAGWDNAIEQYGTIPKGERPTRDVPFDDTPIPKSVDGKTKVGYGVRTEIEANFMNENMRDDVKRAILDGVFSHEVISDESAMNNAVALIKSGEAESIWAKAVENNSIGKRELACGEALMKMYAQNGNAARAFEIAIDISQAATNHGQALQAMNLIKRGGGVGALYYEQKAVERINNDITKRWGKQRATVEIPEELAGKLAGARSEADVQRYQKEIEKSIADQIPHNFKDKWNAWRYFAMLANPRTHLRNFAGNGIFYPAVKLKDMVAAGMESAAVKAGWMSAEDRSKVAVVNKKYLDFADMDYENNKAYINGDAKYDEIQRISRGGDIFKSKALQPLNRAMDFNSKALEAEDALFLKRHYKRAFGGYLQAKGIDPQKATEAELAAARDYAKFEAEKAVFHDEAAFAEMLNKVAKWDVRKKKYGKPVVDADGKEVISGMRVLGKNAVEMGIEAVVPFKKTPWNILKRGVEYSPAGLMKSITYGAYELKKGHISASEFIDGLASGMTGTAVCALGALLYNLGVLNVNLNDGEEDQFKKLNGEQAFSIKVGDSSYTIDWMAPVCLPLFVGAQFSKLQEQGWQEGVSVIDSLSTIAEPMIEMSMLEGVQSMLDDLSYSKYEDKNYFQAGAESVVQSYFGQAVPTLLGQTARTIDKTRRNSYHVDKNVNSVPAWMQQMFKSNLAKVPGASTLIAPRVDAQGNVEQQSDNVAVRAFQNFISPGTISKAEYNKDEKELLRVHQNTVGEGTVFPTNRKKHIVANGEQIDLTADQYAEYQKEYGQRSVRELHKLFLSTKYQLASDSEKREMIKAVYSKADKAAQKEVIDNTTDVLYYSDTLGNKETKEYKQAAAVLDDLAEKTGKFKQATDVTSIRIHGKDVALDEKQQAEFKKWQQQYIRSLLAGVYEKNRYKKMTTQQQKDYISRVFSYSTAMAKRKVDRRYIPNVYKPSLY